MLTFPTRYLLCLQSIELLRLHGLRSTAHRQGVFAFSWSFLDQLRKHVVEKKNAVSAASKLDELLHKYVDKSTAQRLFSARVALCPIVGGSHFSLIALCEIPTLVKLLSDRDSTSEDLHPCQLSFDSLAPHHDKLLKSFARVIRQVLLRMWNTYGGSPPARQRTDLSVDVFPHICVPVGRQADSVSCGVCTVNAAAAVMQAFVVRELKLTHRLAESPQDVAKELGLDFVPTVEDHQRDRCRYRLLWERLSCDARLLRLFAQPDVSQDVGAPQPVELGEVQAAQMLWHDISARVCTPGSARAKHHGSLVLAVGGPSERLVSLYIPSELCVTFWEAVSSSVTPDRKHAVGGLYGQRRGDGTLVVTKLVLYRQGGRADSCEPTGGITDSMETPLHGLMLLGSIRVRRSPCVPPTIPHQTLPTCFRRKRALLATCHARTCWPTTLCSVN